MHRKPAPQPLGPPPQAHGRRTVCQLLQGRVGPACFVLGVGWGAVLPAPHPHPLLLTDRAAGGCGEHLRPWKTAGGAPRRGTPGRGGAGTLPGRSRDPQLRCAWGSPPASVTWDASGANPLPCTRCDEQGPSCMAWGSRALRAEVALQPEGVLIHEGRRHGLAQVRGHRLSLTANPTTQPWALGRRGRGRRHLPQPLPQFSLALGFTPCSGGGKPCRPEHWPVTLRSLSCSR